MQQTESNTVGVFIQWHTGQKRALLQDNFSTFKDCVVEPSFIINLWAGSSPPALARLPHLEFQHLEVFTSRTREEGRERFRLHLGYFDNSQVAERILQRVREVYPTAWVVPASRHLPLARLKGVVSARLSSGDGSTVTPGAALSGEMAMDVTHPLQTLPLPVPSELPRTLPGVRRSASQVEQPGGSFPKFSIVEWRAEAPPKAEPKPRTWFQRLTG